MNCETQFACTCERVNDEPINIEEVILKIKSKTITDSILIACCYHQIANDYDYYFDDFLESIKHNKKAELIRLKKNDGLLWRTYLNLGINYFNLYEFKQAIAYLKKALDTDGKKAPSDYIDIYVNLAESYLYTGEIETAIDYAKQSVKIQADDILSIEPLYILSVMLLSKGDSISIEESIQYSKKSLLLSQSINDTISIRLALDNIAHANKHKNNFDEAINYYEQALKLNTKDTINSAILLGNIAAVQTSQKLYDLSIQTLSQSMNLFEKYHSVKVNFDYSASYENFADNYTALKQYDTALMNYQKALINLTNNFISENISKNPNPADDQLLIYSYPDMIRVLHLKATAAYQYFQQNNDIQYLTLANQTYQIAFDFHNKLQKDISTENSRLFQAKNIVPYIENALKVAHQQQENGQDVSNTAFRFMEKNKATVLLQAINEADALQFANLPDSLLAQEKELKIALTFHNKQLNDAIEYEETNEIDRLNNILFDERQQYNHLINNLENNYPDYYHLKYQQNQIQLTDVQQALDNQTALLEYFVGDSVIYLLSILKNNAHLYKIKKPVNFKQIINNLRQSISNVYQNDKALFAINSHNFSKLLLNEVLCALPDEITRLQIIPDAELNYIPFEVLLTEDFDANNIQYKNLGYLLKSKSVGYAYSTALWLENLQINISSKTNPYGGYAPAYFDSAYNDLPIARETVKNVSGLLNGQTYLNEQASISNFLNDDKSYNILHLAMHGVLNDKNPLRSYLAFSTTENFKLFANDLYNMKINSDLTILHACNTGAGELQKGEGVMSLSRAFTYAGCPSLVMSLWQIPEEATAEITKSFIENLKIGLTKDVALQKAKLTYLENENTSKITASPVYWAGLVATGNLNAINFQ